MKHKNADANNIDFSCHAPDAKSVFVAGSFNEWKTDAAPMQRNVQKGEWHVSLRIPRGHHEYKFVVDGQWCCEGGCEHGYQGCPKCIPNAFGTMNRLLEVV